MALSAPSGSGRRHSRGCYSGRHREIIRRTRPLVTHDLGCVFPRGQIWRKARVRPFCCSLIRDNIARTSLSIAAPWLSMAIRGLRAERRHPGGAILSGRPAPRDRRAGSRITGRLGAVLGCCGLGYSGIRSRRTIPLGDQQRRRTLDQIRVQHWLAQQSNRIEFHG